MTDTLERLRAANPKLNILPISDPSFERYGHWLTRYDPGAMIARTRSLLPRSETVVYEPSVPELEESSRFNTEIIQEIFGGMDTQVGWCYGLNNKLNALEYHKGSEVAVCLTETVFLVGHVQDVEFGAEIRYDTSKVAAYLAPAGSVVELSPWNLHFAPINAIKGQQFCTLVYLPRGTNEPLPFELEKTGTNRLLTHINKWLIAHPEATDLVKAGAYPGLIGDNIVVHQVSEI